MLKFKKLKPLFFTLINLSCIQISFAITPHCVALNHLSTDKIAADKSSTNKISSNKNSKIPLDKIINFVDFFIFQQSDVPGLMIGIISGNESVLISCGETAKGNGERPKANTIWAIGSTSKVITGTIFAKMVAAGKVGLTDTVDKFWPANSIPNFQNTKITLLNLATHTSGFARMPDEFAKDTGYQNQKTYNIDYALQWMKTATLLFRPGTQYLYSNFAFGLLGQSLARVENTTFAALVNKYITQELNMSDTTTQLNAEQKKREAKSYWMNGDLITTDWPFDFEAPSGGVYSTGNDLIKFIKYNLQSAQTNQIDNANKLAHATYVYQNEVSNPFSFKYDGMGLGWHIIFPQESFPVLIHKNGWVNGFTTWMMFLPTANIGVFSISNKPYLNINYDLRSIMGMILDENRM